MSISTYAELQTAISNWSGRADLTSRAPEFIALAEAKINRLLATRDMETKDAAFSITGEYVAVPTGFGAVREFYLNTNPKQILQLMPGDTQTQTFGSDSGKPRYYEVVGSNFRFGPVPDGTYSATLIYSKTIAALSGSNTTNWLLTAYPDIYLYGSLLELSFYLKNHAHAGVWKEAYYGCIDELKNYNAQSKWGGNSMAVRLG